MTDNELGLKEQAMNFREMAINAHREHERELAEDDYHVKVEYAKEVRLQFTGQFGVEPDTVYGREVLIDGIKLIQDTNYRGTWHVMITCPHCGEEVANHTSCYSLENIGSVLASEYPPYHDCPAQAGRYREPVERIADALEAIAEHLCSLDDEPANPHDAGAPGHPCGYEVGQ